MRMLKDINKLRLVKAGDALSLVDGEFPRDVRLELNTERPTRLGLLLEDKSERFLAVVEGRDTVVFTIEGPCEVWPSSDGEVWWYTVEMEAAAIVSNAETYTKIAERRARNPDLELVARRMQQNADRRMAALMAEMDKRFAALKPKEESADEPAPVANRKGGRKPAKPGNDAPDEAVTPEPDGDGDDAAE